MRIGYWINFQHMRTIRLFKINSHHAEAHVTKQQADTEYGPIWTCSMPHLRELALSSDVIWTRSVESQSHWTPTLSHLARNDDLERTCEFAYQTSTHIHTESISFARIH